MRRARATSLVGAALAAAVTAAVLVSPPAAAEEGALTLDVLKVVDGEYVVETVTVAAATATAAERSLEADPEVVDASPQVVYQVTGTPDPYLDEQDPGGASRVAEVWPRTRGAGQVVAVLDTAASIVHEDMAGAVLPGTDLVTGPGEPWHGYGAAGVVAARADNGLGGAGMAPESRVLPVRVCNDGGCPSGAVTRGVLWAADHGADVINMSLSGAGYSDVTAAAIQYALDKDIVVVASAGNDGLNGNPVMWPAANSGVIAVSSTGPDGVPSDWAVHGWQVDVSTVGDSVLLPMPGDGYGNGTGTSFSGPAVAGAVALLRASHPGIGVEEVQAALQAGADSTAWDRGYGAGRLDVPAAMAAADRATAGVAVTGSPQAVGVTWPGGGATTTAVRLDGTVRATAPGTSASVTGLTDGIQVAVDVQPDGGQRSAPVLATVGTAAPAVPTLHAAALRGTPDSAVVDLTVSVTGATATRYALIRDGVSVGTLLMSLSSTPRTIGMGIGAMPTYETRWQLRAVDPYYRMSQPSNAVVAGSGRPPAPAAPTGLDAQLDGDRVLLSWDDVGSAHTYRVTVGGSTVASPQTAGAVLAAPPAGVARGYDVAVVDAWGQAGPTAGVQVTGAGSAPPPLVAPGAPGDVAAVAGDGQATVSWSAPAAGGAVTGYRVTAAPGGATATTTGATSVPVTGLANGTAYTFTVTATNAAGTGPASAASAAVTPAGPPAAPTGVTAVRGDGRATVSWTAAADNGRPVTGYRVTASPGGAVAETTGATTATVAGLTNGTAYTFTVTATNDVGTGPASAPSTAVTPAVPASVPGAPTAVTAVAGDGRATVSWSPAADNGSPVSEYTVTASPGGATVTGTGTTATVTGLANGTAHTFRVAARNALGAGPESAPSPAVTPRAPTAIAAFVAASGGGAGPLGAPTSEERCGLRGGGCFQRFSGGSVYWSPAGGAHLVSGAVLTRWGAQGWERGALGYPTTDPVCSPAGCHQQFQGGSVAGSTAGGARVVVGAIRSRWVAVGRESGALGFPTSEERCGLRGGGCFQRFTAGSVYWSPAGGAHPVSGAVLTRWGAQGWETGALGYPTADPGCSPAGCHQQFQGGSVASSTAGGARAVVGAIRSRWVAVGRESGALGFPTSEERCGLRGGGCFQRFTGGSVYWSPAGGAWPVAAPVTAAWGAQGWETGRLGYPVGAATCSPAGSCSQRFQGGTASWTPTTAVRFSR